MKNVSLQLSAAALLVLGAASCKKEPIDNVLGVQKAVYVNGSDSNCADLVAGQNIIVGDVCFFDVDTNNDGEKDALEVQFNTNSPWVLDNVHVWVGNTMPPMTKKGNVIPGQFPYHGNANGATTITITVPFSGFAGGGYTCGDNSNWSVAAHAEVRDPNSGQTETGWSYGDRLNAKGNWAMSTIINIDCYDDGDEDDLTTETAFAVFAPGSFAPNTIIDNASSICFEGKDCDGNPTGPGPDRINNWGWTNMLAAGVNELSLYAGAAQCNLTKGTLSGSVTVNFDPIAGTAMVTVSMLPGYSLTQAHLYIGSNLLPPDGPDDCTVAPGQYPVNAGALDKVSTYTYTYTGLGSSAYMVFHGVVYGFPK